MSTNNTFVVQQERRLCEANGKLGYFHCWESYKDYFYGYVIGIVEFADSVQRVDPTCIKFVDDQNRELELLEKVHKKVKEAQKHDVQRETDKRETPQNEFSNGD